MVRHVAREQAPKTTKKRLGITAEGEPGTLERTLSRITVPKDVRERLAGLLANGSSLSITDTESGLETGKGTDFITVTRSGAGEEWGDFRTLVCPSSPCRDLLPASGAKGQAASARFSTE